MRKYKCPGELQISGIIDLGPRKTCSGAKTDVRSLIDEFLQSCIEELVGTAGPDQMIDPAEQPAHHRAREYGDADIRAAEIRSFDAFTHPDHAASRYDYFHCFIAPVRIHNHGGGRITLQGIT